jgi:Tfp pilus assembly protein PilO
MNQDKLKDQIRLLRRWLTNWYQLIAVILYAAILLCGYIYLLKPTMANVINLQKNQLSALIENKDAGLYSQELTKFINRSQKFEADNKDSLRQLINFLPEKPAIPQLFTLFEYFFKDSGFTVNNLDFTEVNGFESKSIELGEKNGQQVVLPALDPDVGVINVSAKISGGQYGDIKNMLAKMETIGRLVDLNNLVIQANVIGKDKQDYSLQMRTYYYKGK